MSSNKNDIINKSSNGADGFDKLMKTLYSFLKATERQAGVGNSKTGSYTYTNNSTDPHTLSNGQTQTQNTNITESFSAALNIIKNIVDNNYMKLNNITISNDYYPLNSHKKIPALNDYQALVNYWKDNGAAACNGACVGYCSGSCSGATKHGTSGSTIDDGKSWGCNKCTAECAVNCTGTCHSQNARTAKTITLVCSDCSPGCKSSCLGCQENCKIGCGLNCGIRCASSCGGCFTNCTGNCSGDCNSCSSKCGSGCEGECGGTCQNKCGSTCGGTCMFGSDVKPITGGQNHS